MGAELADIVFDCARPTALARFWAAALDGYEVAPYDDTELARLAAMSIDDTEDDPTVLVESAGGPRLWFQQVPESKMGKNRVHLDIRADVRSVEERRLVALGASSLPHQPNPNVTVMHDPEGNEFCLIDRIPEPKPGGGELSGSGSKS